MRAHTHTQTVLVCVSLVKLALCPRVNRVCVLTTNVLLVLYNMCESVAVSSGTPGVFTEKSKHTLGYTRTVRPHWCSALVPVERTKVHQQYRELCFVFHLN